MLKGTFYNYSDGFQNGGAKRPYIKTLHIKRTVSFFGDFNHVKYRYGPVEFNTGDEKPYCEYS